MPSLTQRKLLPLALLLLPLVMAACAGAFTPEELSLAPSPGETLPVETLSAETAYRFTLPSALDGRVSLDSYAGEQNVVLVFYRGFW